MGQPTHLHEPLLKFPILAFRKTRLIDFPTGKDMLLKEHEGWLVEAARAIPDNRNFHIYIFGYASKLGFRGMDQRQSDQANVALSFKRATQAARLLEIVNPSVTTHIDSFVARGNEDYSAGAQDDSGMWRAVEVFVFLDASPPPPPPCPGGVRFWKWSIATPGGITFNPVPGAALAGNIVIFRSDEGPPMIHEYVVPVPGVAGPIPVPA